MKKSILRVALVAMVGALVASCSLFTEPTSFQEDDLIGLWQEDGTKAFGSDLIASNVATSSKL